MGTIGRTRYWVVAALLMLAPLMATSAAHADTPKCDAVNGDPTIPTCTCICESPSEYKGCSGLSAGTPTPTPEQCPDMLQGRHVLSRGDGLVLASPNPSVEDLDGVTAAQALIYAPENQDTTPPLSGLGKFAGHPWLAQYTNISCTMPSSGGPFPDHAVLARLFDLPSDVMVQLRPTTTAKSDCGSNGGQDNMELITSTRKDGEIGPVLSWVTNPQWTQLAVGDFNYDGYDDLVFLNTDHMNVFTAVDPTDPSKGIKQVASVDTRLSSGALRAPINTPVTGDFNGDGIMDVAWIGGNFQQQTGTLSVFFASICPGSVTGTICEGKQPFQVILDPAHELFPDVSGATSTIALDNATLTPTGCGVVASGKFQSTTAAGSQRAGAIALGNFEDNGLNPRGAPTDELVIAYVSGTSTKSGSTDTCSVDAQYWSFSAPDSTNPVWAVQRGSTVSDLLGETHSGSTSNVPTFSLYAQAAYLDWYGTTEQAVIGLTAAQAPFASWWWPVVVSVTGSGQSAEVTACAGGETGVTSGFPFAWGLAVGRFSTSETVNPANPGACDDFDSANPGDCPYNPQIAMLVQQDYQNSANTNGTGNPSIQLYSVVASEPNGSDTSRKCTNDPNVQGYLPLADQNDSLTGGYGPFALPPASLRAGNLLGPGDAFGNSVRLGPPTIVRVNAHSEPQLIIQAPPSHIDYVEPDQTNDDTGGEPTIFNFTSAPNYYQTQIQFDTESDATASTRETRSISSSTTETASGEVKYKVPLIAQVDAKDKQSWTQFHESNQQQQLSTYYTTRLQTNSTVAADDQVWWTETTFNVFNYPELGVTACPASTTCDPSDQACSGALSGATLTCSKPTSGSAGYPGCTCVSAAASGSTECPTLPTDGTSRSCASQSDGSVCCTLQPQQLNVSFSGPQEVIRNVQSGATIEWYQPRHEPGQILSYPSSLDLIKARQQGSETLATLSSFSLSSDSTSQSIGWTCGTNSDVSTGTTTRHSFASDSSITFGTNKIAEDAAGAANAALAFDYQHSDSFSTLNTYTVGQTASSSVALLMKGTAFYTPDLYGYNVSGAVFGAAQPPSVLDNPDLTVCPADNPNCSAAQEVQADCQTTGPLTIAFTANPPPATSPTWWGGETPYASYIDVALNNPLRWRKIQASQALNETLQCRGPSTDEACYDTNNPPAAGATLSTVWTSMFYSMKGLFVTDGGTAGPMRNTATDGDTIYLRARVYNYSLMDTGKDNKVYARFYRQQVDVNKNGGVAYATGSDGKTLTAVPIGPNGLGDTTPVAVVGPDGVSNVIPQFNTSSEPSKDNIGLATVSYTTAPKDDCEYDGSVQSCNGAYYVYWVTVWAEDANGNVISELPGHGLRSGRLRGFDPTKIYNFITDVPLQYENFTSADGSTTILKSFTNNVGMFKMVFSIVPQTIITAGTSRPRPGPLSLDQMHISSDTTVLGSPVVVSAQVVESGTSAPGATVVFSDGDPHNGGKTFDAEWLPTIRTHDRHFVSVNYNPESCGLHEIYTDVTGGSNVRPAEQVALLDVGIDYKSSLDYLIRKIEGLSEKLPGHKDPWRTARVSNEHERSDEDVWRKPYLSDSGISPGQIVVIEGDLRRIERALDAGRTDKGVHRLEKFTDLITRLERKGWIDTDQADRMIAQVQKIIGCIQ